MRYSRPPPGMGAPAVRFHMTPWVKGLLIANAAVFLIAWFATWFGGARTVFDLFAFSPANIWSRPWGIVTYMFVHAGFWHLLMNSLFIFFFGPPLESRWGSNIFIRFYLICGLGGVLLSFAFSDSAIVGASAACYGMMLAFAMIWPNTPVYVWGLIPVKVKWLVIVLVGISFLSAIGPSGGGIAHMAHLGGAIAGFVMMKGGWLPAFAPGPPGRSWGRSWGRSPRSPRKSRKPRTEAPKRAQVRRRQRQRTELDQVDAVLDKISQEGIHSLTAEERDLLDRVSRRTRAN